MVVMPNPFALAANILSDVRSIGFSSECLRATDKILQSGFFLSNPLGRRETLASSIQEYCCVNAIEIFLAALLSVILSIPSFIFSLSNSSRTVDGIIILYFLPILLIISGQFTKTFVSII